jgi:hypothetical protein
MIRKLYVDNFRCLEDFELELDAQVLLLGDNGSGKSAVFDAIAGLRSLVRGVDAAVAFPDTVRGLRQDPRLRIELTVASPLGAFVYGVTLFYGNAVVVEREQLVRDGVELVKREHGVGTLAGAQGPVVFPSPAVHSSLLALFDPDSAHPDLRWFLDFMDRVWVIRPNPAAMTAVEAPARGTSTGSCRPSRPSGGTGCRRTTPPSTGPRAH